MNKIGPLYYIIEDLENLADEYKYMCNYIYEIRDKDIDINKKIISAYADTNNLLREFYEYFYDSDEQKLIDIGKGRKQLIKLIYNLFEEDISIVDTLMLHYLLVIAQKIFCLVGPTMILKDYNSSEVSQT